ncbi:MAG: TetR/AcrR family transcriptional regulator [Nitrospiraceae bacterium]|nr:MAG: TetR/AcrR family transcriptional regulator [Nitrospiraceae bacterium]
MNRRSAIKIPKPEILKTALKLFSDRGYSETKMTDIAREAGLSVGALYLRFRSKEYLCLELIQDQTRDYEELAEAVVASCSGADEALEKYIAFCLGYAFRKRQLITLLYREHRLHFLKPVRSAFMRSQQKLIESILHDGIRKGIMRPMDVKKMSLMIFAGLRGAIMLKLFFGIGSAPWLSKSLFDLISSGVRKGPR